jgi:hypothetical protein
MIQLFYSYSSLNHPIPLKLIDFSTYSIEEDNKWMTEQKEKIFHLTLNAIKGKKFPLQLFKVESEFMQDMFGSETETLLFPTRSMALQAFEYLKNAFEGKTTAAENSNEKLLRKVLADKGDVDFEFLTSSLSSVPFKYYYHNDSLWFSGTNLYATVIPVNAIDFERTIYYLESSLWKTKAGDKCIEVPLYAIKGKLYAQEFDIAQFEKHFGGEKIDFANLILPNKAFAEELIKYLKAQRP